MRIMGVDPGGTTGVAIIDVEWDDSRFEPDPRTTHVFDTQIPAVWTMGPNSVAWELREIIEDYEPDLIAVENFIITQRTIRYTRQPDALWVIGGIHFLANTMLIPVHVQTASLAKTTWPDTRITSSGWGKVVKQKHARDALKHALTACVTWKP